MRPLIASPAADAACRQLGYAHALMSKTAGNAVKTDALSGRLYFSSSGWLLLSVPNALGQGAFDALDEAGVELPTSGSTGRYNAHITVMRPDEVEHCGGAAKITERGHSYRYSLGPVKEVEPAGQADLSKVWFIEVSSPDLKELRRSYGLSALPNDDKYEFHITFAQRKKNVLKGGPVSKVAADDSDPEVEAEIGKHRAEKRGPEGEYCPHCDARLERDPYSGTCNRCGKDWPEKQADACANLALLLASSPADRLLRTLGVA